MTEETAVQFVPFSSFVDPSFWWSLTDKKLHEYQLDESEQHFKAYYSSSDSLDLPCRMSLDLNALNVDRNCPANSIPCNGHLFLKNTIESFKKIDKKMILQELGMKIWSDIVSGEIFHDLSSLCRVCLLSYIDIKKYYYYYWFAYPAVACPVEIRLLTPSKTLVEAFSADQINVLQPLCTNFARNNNGSGYFLIETFEDKTALQITTLEKLKDNNVDSSKFILGFFDPSTDRAHPGWPLRNLLVLWGYYRKWQNVRVLCWRQRYQEGKLDCNHSLVLDIAFTQNAEPSAANITVFGWEKNENGQLAPRFVDLSSNMDSTKIAENAVDLNLQLMRWRLVPDLDLNVFKQTSCLLIGSGTLGCNVARALLGWGVRKITFVDNAKVSFSNPVRQSLFTFEDCLNGGKFKAEAAAESMKKIFPNIETSAVHLKVPMPGHVVTSKEEADVKKNVESLEKLIAVHDVVFLLLDTREGRWLPTLLSTLHSKLTFSVALGFDSFLVVRHGYGHDSRCHSPLPITSKRIDGDQLGCYFCSDVTAPANSTADRTLDQQCTVTRPGVSMIAAAFAIELMASVLQHPLKGLAPAEIGDQSQISCLGCAPHQIRGFLSRLDQMTPAVQRFPKCTACSNIVLDEYTKNGFQFLLSVFNDPSALERLTGLDELQNISENAEVWELSDNESVRSVE